MLGEKITAGTDRPGTVCVSVPLFASGKRPSQVTLDKQFKFFELTWMILPEADWELLTQTAPLGYLWGGDERLRARTNLFYSPAESGGGHQSKTEIKFSFLEDRRAGMCLIRREKALQCQAWDTTIRIIFWFLGRGERRKGAASLVLSENLSSNAPPSPPKTGIQIFTLLYLRLCKLSVWKIIANS